MFKVKCVKAPVRDGRRWGRIRAIVLGKANKETEPEKGLKYLLVGEGMY